MTDEDELYQIRSEVKRPDDFDDFWRRTLDELAEVDPQWDRIEDDSIEAPGRTVYTVRIHSIDDSIIYAWLAVPKHIAAGSRWRGDVADSAEANGLTLPGYLWLPGYSLGNPPPGPESLYDGVITMGLNVHGNYPDAAYVNPYTISKDYVTDGIESPDTYIFRRIVAHCVRAFEVLLQQPEVDARVGIVGGMSQGGGLALIAAALLGDRVRLCFADMPWLCDLDRALSLVDRERYRRVPNLRVPDGRWAIEEYALAHPELREQIFKTYRYFDPLSHANRIVAPTQMSAGGRDPSCRPPTIFSVYNEIRAEKEMQYLPTTGHEIVKPMWDAHANWLRSRLQ